MSELIEVAKGWASRGFKIVPIKLSLDQKREKAVQPLWKWVEETYPGFERLNWAEANAYGIVLGATDKGWLCYVDVDEDALVKNDPFTTLIKAFPQVANSYIERSPNGFHVFVYMDKASEVSNINLKDKFGLELHVNGLCIMAPSTIEGKQYGIYNNANIVKIPDFYQQFKTQFTEPKPVAKKKSVKRAKGEIRPCIKTALEKRHIDHLMRLAIAAEYKGLGYDDKAIAEMFRGQDDFNLDKTLYQIRTADPSKVAKCETIKEMGYCLGPEKCDYFNEVFNVKRQPFIELSDGRLCEQAYDGKEIYWLVYDPKTGKVERASQVVDGETTYMPLEHEEIKMGIVLLPSDVAEYNDDKQLFQEIINYMDSWHEQLNRKERKLDALYVMMTYLSDLLPKTSYRRALGPFGRGKSAWEDVVGSVCYRPIFLSGCDTDKSFCRRLDRWRGTAVIDEGDYDNSSLYAFIIKVLNVGYDRRRGYYTRCDDIDPQKTINYYVYSPKVISSRERYKDTALESRCLTFIAKQNVKPMPLHRMLKFEEQSKTLRNKLLLWRFRNYHKMKAQAEILETTKIEEELGLQHITSRIKEIIAPIFLVSTVLTRDEVSGLAYELDEQLKTDFDYQLEQQFNHALIEIIDELEKGDTSDRNDRRIGKPSSDLQVYLSPSQQKDKEKLEGPSLKIPLTKIAKKILDEEEPEEGELRGLCKSLSRIFRDRLGFQIISGKGRKRFVLVPGAYYSCVTFVTSVTLPEQKIISVEGLTSQTVGPYWGFLIRLQNAKLFWLMYKTKQSIKEKGSYFENNRFFIGSMRHNVPKGKLLDQLKRLQKMIPKAKLTYCYGKLLLSGMPILGENFETVPGCFGTRKPILYWLKGCKSCAWDALCLQYYYEHIEKHRSKGDNRK